MVAGPSPMPCPLIPNLPPSPAQKGEPAHMDLQTIRIGCGAGFSSDRLGPAIDLAQRGALDYFVFECIGERTMAFGHRDRMLDPTRGYNPQLKARMQGVLAHCHANGTK